MSTDIKLPKDWKAIPLGEVCKLKNGFAFKSSHYKTEGVPVIRISDIKDGLIVPRNTVRVSENKAYDDYIINTEDILVAMSGATTGKFGIFKTNEIAYQNQRVGKFNILNKELLDNNFLLHQLHSLKRQIEKDAYGGAQPNISSKKIEEMEIVLPPLSTQQAIVSKIEELFSELDNGIANLKTAQQQLKTYRQSVLKWAFEGRFTSPSPKGEGWGEVKEGELPKGWNYVRLGDLVDNPKQDLVDGPFGSNLKSEEYVESGIPVFKIQNIKANVFRDKNMCYVTKEKAEQLKRHSFKAGDLIITKLGEPLGLCCAVPEKYEFGIIVADLMRIRPSKQKVDTTFLRLAINSVIVQNQFKKITKGTTRARVNLTIVRDITIPLGSLQEQQKIVQEIESRLSVADKMEESINQSLQQAEALRQSILKKAFSGELLPSSPTLLPAEKGALNAQPVLSPSPRGRGIKGEGTTPSNT